MIRNLLDAQSQATGEMAILTIEKSTSTPPTYTKTNEFTEPWQDVIDTYGIPKYQEANPALFATVTFPFIFGMMYGDIGHGSLLTMAGIYLVQKGEQFKFTVPALYN